MKNFATIRTIYKEYKNLIIYWLIGLNIFGMIIAIRVFINYRTIVSSIETTIEQTRLLTEQNYYSKNFLKPYLTSGYSPLFLAHKNNRIFAEEKLIALSERVASKEKNSHQTTWDIPSDIDEQKPQDARKEFLQERRESNKF